MCGGGGGSAPWPTSPVSGYSTPRIGTVLQETVVLPTIYVSVVLLYTGRVPGPKDPVCLGRVVGWA